MPAPQLDEALAVDVHGLAVSVRCPFPGARAAIADRFAAFQASASPRADIEIEFRDGVAPASPNDARLVYESAHGQVLYAPSSDELHALYRGGVRMRCHPALGRAEVVVPPSAEEDAWLLSRPMITLPLMECARRRGLYPLHAACLSHKGRGVVIAGASGSGKTTLAVALARAGLDFLSDDLVFLPEDRGSTLLGFPDELGLAGRDAPPGWPKAREAVESLAEVDVLGECRVALLVVLTGDDSEPRLLTASQALLALLPSMLLTDAETCRRHFAAFENLARVAPAWRAGTGLDPEKILRELHDDERTLDPCDDR